MNKILLVEDDQHLADLIRKGLEEDGYHIEHCKDGFSGLQELQNKSYELVILDILLPKMNGLEVCRQIRDLGYRTLPILMLTALGSAENVALGLDSGADDYMGKPFKLIELQARVRNLLRRSELVGTTNENPAHVLRFADIELNDNTKVVSRDGRELNLTSTEYHLLYTLMKSPGKVFSRNELLETVWGYNFDIGTNVVDVYINYLRKKLELPGSEKLIQTVIRMGYALKRSE